MSGYGDTGSGDGPEGGHLSADQLEVLREELLREQIKLAALMQALRRMEEGDYGCCVECGGEIPFDRLEVFPETPTCLGCSA